MIIVITGPTGVGKTKLSEEIAAYFKATVINADSMQIYKGLDIGTAKIKEEEKLVSKHLLFDIKEVDEMYTVFDYQKDVRKILDNNCDDNFVLVGGTGLYIKAALYDYEFALENEECTFEDKTNAELLQMVKKLDPNTSIHVNNRKRLIRRLNKKSESNKGNNPLYNAIYIGLKTDREKLYDRINNRVDEMIQEGLIDEVKSFYDKKINSKAIKTGIGYKELYEYFDGNITLDETIELIKSRSRKYAKRQFTWFNNQMDIKWFDVDFDNFSSTIEEVKKYIEELK